MRTHVVLPEELVEGVDAFVGKRSRSRFIAEATAEKLRIERLAKAIEEVPGYSIQRSIPTGRHPKKSTGGCANCARRHPRTTRE